MTASTMESMLDAIYNQIEIALNKTSSLGLTTWTKTGGSQPI